MNLKNKLVNVTKKFTDIENLYTLTKNQIVVTRVEGKEGRGRTGVGNYCFLNIYLAVLHLSCSTGDPWSLLWHVGSLVVACGIQFPDQGSNLGPLLWEL